MVDANGTQSNFFDVVIIGAGISGVNCAYRLQEQSPDRTYTILEARDAIGGTWDLFRYPGIRSDSDLHTFGFPFNPWTEDRAIADGASIKRYMEETARINGIDKHIQFHHKLLTANWSTDAQGWSFAVDARGEKKHFHSSFVIFCTGYYDYNKALPAQIPGIDKFEGPVIHPQFWPEDLDYKNKNVVIIGSGATAVTLLPSLAKEAAQVTMLQRSPSYILALPQVNAVSYWSRRLLPASWAHQLTRLQFLILPFLFFKFCRSFPGAARKQLKDGAAKLLPKDYPLEPNFEPMYNPWDQRLCISPNGDFYQALRDGNADVVTAHIEQVTEKSIILKDSDRTLYPDIIVTATGLKVLMAGGVKVTVDNTPVNICDKHLWKGVMIQDVPNAAIVVGYTNASWTLGADATAQFVTRILNKMKRDNASQAVPKLDESISMKDQPILNLNSTYIVKAEGTLPKAGDRAPWLPRTYYLRDLWDAKFGSITQDIHFSRVST